jgi:hypothetical protein
MAAGLRKLMFDNKKPTWGYGICIAVVCEVIHMILIFLTNMDNSYYAFEFVKGATIPMILGNAIAVGFAIVIVSLLSHEQFIGNKGKEGIAHTFQRWLLACIVIAYFVTSTFTYILQSGITKVETQKVFTAAIGDVESDINGKSDMQLLSIAKQVGKEYESNPEVSLQAIADKYGIDYMSAARAFLTSETHSMIEDPKLEMWEFSERAIFEMWEVERITGDPRNSSYLRSE